MQVKFIICCTAADIFVFPQTPGEARRLYLKEEREDRNQIPAEKMHTQKHSACGISRF